TLAPPSTALGYSITPSPLCQLFFSPFDKVFFVFGKYALFQIKSFGNITVLFQMFLRIVRTNS
ncbi:MAG: hypothetical protein IJ240_09370, partial [Clostridia bacterium]|nr:hypothetical protein [Clostridia bacterium]